MYVGSRSKRKRQIELGRKLENFQGLTALRNTMIQLKKIIKIIPKLDPIVETITTNAKQKKIAKLIIRAIQIVAVVYLLSKGLIDDEQAVEIIK